MSEWWKLKPIIAPLPKGFMDDDRSHQEAKDWMDRAADEVARLRARVVELEGQHKGLVIQNGILRQRDDLPVDRLPVMREVERLTVENEQMRAKNDLLRVLLHDAVWTVTHKKNPHWLNDALAALKVTSDAG